MVRSVKRSWKWKPICSMKKPKEKPDKRDLAKDEPKNITAFVDAMLRHLHDGLLLGGSREMRRILCERLEYFRHWHRRAYPEPKKPRKRKKVDKKK